MEDHAIGPLDLTEAQSILMPYPSQKLKALVWFWLIDETLSVNLVYQSDHEIGSTFQAVKQNGEDHDDGVDMMIKCLDLEKKKEKNKNLKVKVKFDRSFLVW